MTIKNHIAVFDGDKGGVGKSFACRAYIDLLLNQQEPALPVCAIDCDPRNPDIYRTFHNKLKVIRVALYDEAGWAKLYDYICSDEVNSQNIAISLPAGIGIHSDRWGAIFKKSLSQTNNEVLTFWVLGKDIDSRNLLNTALEKGSLLPHRTVVVLNDFFNESPVNDVYETWHDSSLKKDFIASGGRVITLPKLATRIVLKLEQKDSEGKPTIIPFSDVNFDNYYNDNTIKEWLSKVKEAFSPILTTEKLCTLNNLKK